VLCPFVSELSVTNCFSAKCAIYDEEKNCCSIKVIAKELSRMQVQEKDCKNEKR